MSKPTLVAAETTCIRPNVLADDPVTPAKAIGRNESSRPAAAMPQKARMGRRVTRSMTAITQPPGPPSYAGGHNLTRRYRLVGRDDYRAEEGRRYRGHERQCARREDRTQHADPKMTARGISCAVMNLDAVRSIAHLPKGCCGFSANTLHKLQ